MVRKLCELKLMVHEKFKLDSSNIGSVTFFMGTARFTIPILAF